MIFLRSLRKTSKLLLPQNLYKSYPSTLIFTSHQAFFTRKSSLSLNDLADHIKNGLAASQNNDLDAGISHLQTVINACYSKENTYNSTPQGSGLLLRAHYELGRIHEKKGEWVEALKQYRGALELVQTANLTDSVEHGEIHNAIGRIYMKEARLQEDNAQPFLKEAGEIFKKLAEADKLNPQHLDSAYMRSLLQGNQSQGTKALELLEYLKDKQEDQISSKNGKEGIDLAVIYNSLGDTYLNMNESEKALGVWNKGIKFIKEQRGESSHQLISLYHSIAQSFLGQQRYDEAHKYIEESLNICKRLSGKDDAKLAESLLLSGLIYFRQEKFDQALESYEKGIEILAKYPNQYREEVWMSYLTLAEIKLAQRDQEKTFDYFRQAEQLIISTLGKYHPELAGYYLYFADLLKFRIGDKVGAREFYRKALDTFLKSGTVQEPKIIDTFYEIGPTIFEESRYAYSFTGALYFQQHKLEESAESFHKAIDASVAGDKEKDLDVYCWSLGKAFEQRGLVSKSVEFYKKAVEIAEKQESKDKKAVEDYKRSLTEKLEQLGRKN